MPFTAVVFDLDGTLIDSAPDIRASANHMLEGLGTDPLDLETVISFIGNGIPKLVERCLAHVNLPANIHPEALAAFSAHYNAHPMTLTEMYPGAASLLTDLACRDVALGICTNKPEAPARAILEGLGIAGQFQAVIGGDTLPVRKPDPAPLHAAIAALGATPETTLYVGDSETDYLTARNAGIPIAYFTGGYQRRPIEDFRPYLTVSHLSDIRNAFA